MWPILYGCAAVDESGERGRSERNTATCSVFGTRESTARVGNEDVLRSTAVKEQ